MAGKKQKSKPDSDSCIGNGHHEPFGMIYESLVKSEPFQNLSMPAKLLYMYCRINANSSDGRSCLYNHSKQEGVNYPQNAFVFPARQMAEFGLVRTNTHRYMKELIQAGFIEICEENKHRRKVNIYKFSSKWKEAK